jgi:rhodanese-related sulfurtransferase
MRAGVVPRRSPEEIRELRAKRGDARVLDVRTRDARELHPQQIPGADWVPLADVVEYARSLPRDIPLVIYCT